VAFSFSGGVKSSVMVWITAGLVFIALCGLWILVPVLHGLPWVPTRQERIRRALKLAGLQPGETLYDLGSGDGRVLVIAAREFGARAVGIEVGPIQVALAALRLISGGVAGLARVRLADFYTADLAAADVVFVYATSGQMSRLQSRLESQLRPGTRVVSISADFPGWQPCAYDRQELIFLYGMPPVPGSLESFLAREAGRIDP